MIGVLNNKLVRTGGPYFSLYLLVTYFLFCVIFLAIHVKRRNGSSVQFRKTVAKKVGNYVNGINDLMRKGRQTTSTDFLVPINSSCTTFVYGMAWSVGFCFCGYCSSNIKNKRSQEKVVATKRETIFR